jgi:hypothetical protein
MCHDLALGLGAIGHMWYKNKCRMAQMSLSLGFGGVLVPCGLGGLDLGPIKHIWFKHLGTT